MSEETNPFSLDELDKLFDARWYRDVDYVFDWTKRAVKWYESEKQRLLDQIQSLSTKASKDE